MIIFAENVFVYTNISTFINSLRKLEKGFKQYIWFQNPRATIPTEIKFLRNLYANWNPKMLELGRILNEWKIVKIEVS